MGVIQVWRWGSNFTRDHGRRLLPLMQARAAMVARWKEQTGRSASSNRGGRAWDQLHRQIEGDFLCDTYQPGHPRREAAERFHRRAQGRKEISKYEVKVICTWCSLPYIKPRTLKNVFVFCCNLGVFCDVVAIVNSWAMSFHYDILFSVLTVFFVCCFWISVVLAGISILDFLIAPKLPLADLIVIEDFQM